MPCALLPLPKIKVVVLIFEGFFGERWVKKKGRGVYRYLTKPMSEDFSRKHCLQKSGQCTEIYMASNWDRD